MATQYVTQNGKVLGYITKCKCGNVPKAGGQFWYKSKYSTDYLVGTIRSVEGRSIVSTTGVAYPKDDIELKPRSLIRMDRLKELGIIDDSDEETTTIDTRTE